MESSRAETSELQQLVSSDGEGENEDSIAQDENLNETKLASPVRSARISSGNTSHSSVHGSAPTNASTSKISFINERRVPREPTKSSTVRPRNVHKGHMERALLGLLADFHSGKLRAFGSGCTMEQMTNIREQQEKLAKLHFDLGAATDPSLSDESLRTSQNTMSQLIQRLEQLSMSIEGLHNSTNN